MNTRPLPFEPGRSFQSQFTARRMNDLISQIPRVRFSGGGARISNFGGQTFVQIPRIPSPGVPIKYTPFQIFATKHIVSGIWDGTYDVTLYPGVVNQLLPTNMFDVMNQGIESTQYIILTCESDGYSVTSSTWSISSSPNVPVDATVNTPPSEFTVLIGVIFYNSGPGTISVYQIINNNIIAAPEEWIRDSNPDIEPFGLAYEIYYYWNITT